MTVRLTSAARADLTEALHWYRRRGAGLERRYLLHSFPYVVFYLARDQEVVVIGCMHGARDPESRPRGGAA